MSVVWAAQCPPRVFTSEGTFCDCEAGVFVATLARLRHLEGMTSAKTLCALLLCAAGCGDDSAPAFDASFADLSLRSDAIDVPATGFDDCTDSVGIPLERGDEFDRFYQLMDFTNEELSLRMRVALSPGPYNGSTGLAISYETRALSVESSGTLSCIRDQTRLSYDVTHHNDTDTFTALISPDELYSVSMIFDRVDNSFTDTLTIEHPESGAPSEGPYALVEAGCSVHREGGLVGDCTYQTRAPY